MGNGELSSLIRLKVRGFVRIQSTQPQVSLASGDKSVPLKSKEPLPLFLAHLFLGALALLQFVTVVQGSPGCGSPVRLASCCPAPVGFCLCFLSFDFLLWKPPPSSLFLPHPPRALAYLPGTSISVAELHCYFQSALKSPLSATATNIPKWLFSAGPLCSLGDIGQGVETFWVVSTGGWVILVSSG